MQFHRKYMSSAEVLSVIEYKYINLRFFLQRFIMFHQFMFVLHIRTFICNCVFFSISFMDPQVTRALDALLQSLSAIAAKANDELGHHATEAQDF